MAVTISQAAFEDNVERQWDMLDVEDRTTTPTYEREEEEEEEAGEARRNVYPMHIHSYS